MEYRNGEHYNQQHVQATEVGLREFKSFFVLVAIKLIHKRGRLLGGNED